uniref:Uncharacterized protein n=1 Tax=Pavo cristatus TaxID=9049 RepID=A0A8C9ERF3_PAVCR
QEADKEAEDPAAQWSTSAQGNTTQQKTREEILFHEETIDLGGDEFESEGNETVSEDSNNFIDKLNEQMMESVIISDSPNNSEDDTGELGCLQEIVEQMEAKDNQNTQAEVGKEELLSNESETEHEETPKDISEIGTDDQASLKEESIQETEKDEPKLGNNIPVETKPNGIDEGKPDDQISSPSTSKPSAEVEPIPVCTIFSQANNANAQPQLFLPDGFEPQMVKSPSFSSIIETPVKSNPQVVQPSPSLSKSLLSYNSIPFYNGQPCNRVCFKVVYSTERRNIDLGVSMELNSILLFKCVHASKLRSQKRSNQQSYWKHLNLDV